MKITYLYHNGFLIEQDEHYILCDYFLDGYASVAGDRKIGGVARAIGCLDSADLVEKDEIRPMDDAMKMTYPDEHAPGVMAKLLPQLDKPLYILSTHFHKDHFLPFVLKFFDYANERRKDTPSFPEVKLIFSSDIKKYRRKIVGPYMDHITFLAKGDVFEDDALKITALGSTDVGVSFAIESKHGDKSIYHGGDFNDWHWVAESTDKEVQEAHAFFKRELAFMKERFKSFDIVMFDCDPRLEHNFMVGASQFHEAIPFSMLIPMHVCEMGDKTEAAIKADPLFSQMQLSKGAVHEQPDNAIELSSVNADVADKRIWLPSHAGDYCYIK